MRPPPIALRSPYVQTGGLNFFARMLDKIRLERRGELPEAYQPLLGGGFDGRLCRFLGVDYAALAAALRDDWSDADALAWCQAQGGPFPTEEARTVFNQFLRKRGWRDELMDTEIGRMAEACGLDDDGSLQTCFDVIEADEGRPVDAWKNSLALPSSSGALPRVARERAQIFQQHASPLEPVPTNETPRLPRLDGIRAVIFDLYGTLFISASGDISTASEGDREAPLRAALAAVGVGPLPAHITLAKRFHEALRYAQEARRADGIEYPEVEIREVWHHFLAALAADGLSFEQPLGETLARLAIDYECRVNPVWPMPHLVETLAALRLRGLELGIVSNAQFYTRAMFPGLLGVPARALGFASDLCLFSFEAREGKPSVRLYEQLQARLAARGIRAEEVLYVGNDRRNDIWPAQRVGWRTALFAGDARSLRWREEDSRLHAVRPDALLTDLWQLSQML